MPAIEFFGYTESQRDEIITEIRPALSKISCADLITFIINKPSEVIALDGSRRPFIRISTKTEERALEIENALATFTQLKLVFFTISKIKQRGS